MAQSTSSDVVRQASTWSIVWGVLLIVFGMLAVGSPLLAAVAVNVSIGWLIVLAGVVHLILAFQAHRAGSLIWKLLVGLAYLFFGVYLVMHPLLGVASLTLLREHDHQRDCPRDDVFRGAQGDRDHSAVLVSRLVVDTSFDGDRLGARPIGALGELWAG